MANNDNIIYAKFNHGREITTDSRSQYAYGQVLKISGLHLPASFDADISNKGDKQAKVVIGTDNELPIDDAFFLSGKDVIVMINVHAADKDGRTKYIIRIPVEKRPERADIELEPVEQDAISVAIATLNEAVEQTSASAESAENSANRAHESAVNAETSATSASNSEVLAQQYMERAETAAENAEQSETKAKTSEDNAKASEIHAEQIATEIEQYTERAETASTNAQSSASTAMQKATEASAFANIATTKANEASTSATNAQNSADNAQQSATSAQESANSASASASRALVNAEKTQSDKEIVELAKSNVLSAVGEAQNYATTAQSASQAIQDMSVEAVTLGVDSDVTVEKSVDPVTGAVTLTYGIPKGVKGEKGDTGSKGDKGDPFVYSDFTPEQLTSLKGEKGDTGSKGDKGDAFTYADFTPEQLASLKGERGEHGIQGVQGEKGDAFTYADFTPEQLVSLKGEKGDKGDAFEYSDFTPQQLASLKGEKGDKGDAFEYSDFTPEQLASLKGEKGDTGNTGAKGDTGDSGVYVGTSAPSDTNVNVWINPDANDSNIAITVDAVPTQGSTNAVSSGGVYSALQTIELETGEVKDSVESLTEYSIINEESSSDSFHSDENIYGLKVLGNADAFTNIFLADKKNLIPQLNITTETKNGITFSGGGRFWKVSGTSTASTSKSTTPDFVSTDIPAGTYIVRVYRSGSYTASDNPYFSIVGKKADNSTVTIGFFYLNTNPYREWTKTISSDIVSVKVVFAVANGTAITDTLKLWICMFPSDVTITDTGETVSDGATKTLDIDKSLYPDGIDTMQHESVALYNPKIQKYIRDYVANNVPEDVLTTTEIPYVTPEMFGAIGDYSTDDTIAIQNCINYGITNNLPIKMFSRYKTTSSITVAGELIDLYIHTIENVGSGKGIIILGKRCHIVIDKIISVDDAVTLTTDASHDCSMNIIETTWIASRTGRCIVLTTSGGNTSEFNNEIHSKFLYAPNSNCIYIDSAGVSGGETRFIGNGCLINSGSWAFYISGHNTCRFSGFSMENDAQKGVYCADYNAGGYFDDCRVTEMLDRIDSDANDPEKGLFAKGAGVQNIVINGFDIDYKSIDVSECMSFADRLATGETQPGEIGDMRGVRANRISIKRYSDAMAYDEDGTTVLSSQCFVPPATKMLVWFDKKYVISPQDTIHDFSADTTIPNCGIIVPDTFAKIIPTIFNIVGTCVINLSDSYNPIANNRIVVLQKTHGATAQIYDSDGTLVFDGATLGDGEYEIISVVNPATTLETSPKHYHIFTGHNISWLVNKL